MPSLTPEKRKSLPVVGGEVQQSSVPALWRSLAERERGGPDKADSGPEFAEGADLPPASDATSRRSFVQLLGASAALAGLSSACVRRPKEQLLAYTRTPEGVVPGKALHFASSTSLGGTATGLLVTSHDGRPTKIEGNPDHPASLGATGVLEQASLLSLYDPARPAVIKQKGQDRSWRAFLVAQLERAAELKKKGGEGLAFLLEPSASPLLGHLRDRLRDQFPKAKFHSWSSLSADGAVDAAALAFGPGVEPRWDLSRAKVIALLDADLLSGQPGTLKHQRDFAAGRAGEHPSRLYAIETFLTPSGASADHRLPLKPSELPRVAAGLLGRVARLKGGELQRYAGLNPVLPPNQVKLLDALARDLVRAGPEALVVPGPHAPQAVHLAAFALNAGLGAHGASTARQVLHDAQSGPRSLGALATAIKAGQVDTLFVTAWNPAYGAPAELGFGELLASVPNAVYLGAYEDETAAKAIWFLPLAHEMECWGDGRAADGTVTFQQPLIAPLFNGVAPSELLSSLLGEGEKGSYALLRGFYESKAGGSLSEGAWEKAVSDGFVAGTALPAQPAAPAWDKLLPELNKAAAAAAVDGLEAAFAPDLKVWDGRFGNNAWLQELPDPITRLTWENGVLLAPGTAKRLGVEQGDVVDLGLGGRSVRAAIFVQPGQALETAGLVLGYGRSSAAEALCQNVGYRAGALRTSDAFWSAGPLTLAPTGRPKHTLAVTQEHSSMEGRGIALTVTLAELEGKKGRFEQVEELRAPVPSMHAPVKYDSFKWAMAIDLSRCTGCNACVVACQSENNIAVVGKAQVLKSREMQWLRVDRYFSGDPDAPEVAVQPVMCVHCEMAPCEYVCPVNATVHSDEGLNEMVYNRCVGTRYCSNNCPYKVRRFNFFSYTTNYTDVEKMVMNPDVTVRARGVMEKCTYCVQRIERARIETRVAGTQLKDGDIVTACQQACPSQAIVFGSLHDPQSKVSQWHKDERRYDLLHELGTRPRTAYLARVKNPNPELA